MVAILVSLALGAGCSGGSCSVASAPAKHVEKTRIVQRERRGLFARRGGRGCGSCR